MAPAPRPTLVLSGFFGRGNCGDEALLQAQYERFSGRYDIVISVDERGACDGFWDRYPYDRCRIVHQANLSVLAEPAVIGIHVGGGGLPHGFNAAQVVHARSLDKPAFLTGVDCHRPATAAAAAALGGYYGLFDFVSVRSAGAREAMAAIVSGCHHGADWAVGLPTAGPPPAQRRGSVALVLRECPLAWISADYVATVARLLDALSRSHDRAVLLPFCPEDDRFLDHIQPAARLPRERLWWEPGRMQTAIAAAELVVSLGRLHPLVFAANVGTPVAFVEPLAGDPRWPVSGKARQLCAEHGWPYYGDAGTFAAQLLRQPEDLHPETLDRPAAFAPGTRDRWREMADQLEDRLAAAEKAVKKPFSSPRTGQAA
jgi:hypothetical protein